MKVRSKAAQLIMQKQNHQYNGNDNDKQIKNNVNANKHDKNGNEL
jgi:hypothetical protein